MPPALAPRTEDVGARDLSGYAERIFCVIGPIQRLVLGREHLTGAQILPGHFHAPAVA